MARELRKFPRVPFPFNGKLKLVESIKEVSLANISPTGLQLECTHDVVESLSAEKLESGFYPDIQIQFNLPRAGKRAKHLTVCCQVLYCTRFRQDGYHMGLQFSKLNEEHRADIAIYIESRKIPVI